MMKKERERGSLTVECLLFLIPVMCVFFTLVNISRYIQAEVIVHHAITQAAKEISVYSYVLTKADITSRLQATHQKSAKFESDTSDTIDNVKTFMDALGGVKNSSSVSDAVSNVENAYDTGKTALEGGKTYIKDYFSDPKTAVTTLLTELKSKGWKMALSAIAGQIAKGAIMNSLSSMTSDPDAYLENIGIVDGISGLDFSESEWISNTTDDGKANIEITVTYTMHNLMFPQYDFGEREYRLCASTSVW